jgi:hypothetical protein
VWWKEIIEKAANSRTEEKMRPGVRSRFRIGDPSSDLQRAQREVSEQQIGDGERQPGTGEIQNRKSRGGEILEGNGNHLMDCFCLKASAKLRRAVQCLSKAILLQPIKKPIPVAFRSKTEQSRYDLLLAASLEAGRDSGGQLLGCFARTIEAELVQPPRDFADQEKWYCQNEVQRVAQHVCFRGLPKDSERSAETKVGVEKPSEYLASLLQISANTSLHVKLELRRFLHRLNDTRFELWTETRCGKSAHTFSRLAALWFVPFAAVVPHRNSGRNVPIELTANKPYARVQVNGRGPYWFLLDSGASFNVLDKDRATALGISTSGRRQESGAGEGTLTSGVAKGVTLALSGLSIPSREIRVLAVNSAISQAEGRIVDGLRGCGDRSLQLKIQLRRLI